MTPSMPTASESWRKKQSDKLLRSRDAPCAAGPGLPLPHMLAGGYGRWALLTLALLWGVDGFAAYAMAGPGQSLMVSISPPSTRANGR